jgi:outer membrane protein assembly factor BamE (lipoprotein component of BamABCDE complex)
MTSPRLATPARCIVACAFAALALVSLAGCATDTTSTSDPTARQRSNAAKQEALQEMLEKGQRN